MGKGSDKGAERGSNLGAAAKHELVVECLYVALLQLMDSRPYESITVTDICKRAGVSRMAYYRNYQNKGEILIARLDSILETCVRKLEGDDKVDEHAIIARFFAMLQSTRVVHAIVRAGLMDQFVRINLAYARRAYQNVLHLEFNDQKSEMALYQHMGAMSGLVLYLVDKNGAADPNELATMLLGQTRGIMGVAAARAEG